ncbi:MAG: indole-3-glycerol-phosphate synthase TrpC [Candidatus Thermoplasmatota archaeon]|nr:indole-3-glycerol-phosphate synthase TrpC [Candidatus Thermoplasmatota archaeon]
MNTVETIYMNNPGRPHFQYSRTRETISLIGELRRIKAGGRPGIIKEFKRQSPSGFSNDRYPSVRDYFRNKIDARTAGMSILTEPSYFRGSYEDLSICQEFNLPILDKDFISTPAMVENAYNAGSDVILLIMDFLPTTAVKELTGVARDYRMEVLIEFHDLRFLSEIEPMDGVIYGYNRRNLRSLEMEPQDEVVKEFLKENDVDIVLESGLDSSYLNSAELSAFAGFLIGTSVLTDNI